jgi:diacylglycerol kinase family enzyme
MPVGRRRLPAYVALGALLVLGMDLLAVGFGAGPGRGVFGSLLGVLVRMALFVAGAWWAITTRKRVKRVVAAVVAGLAALSIIGEVVRLTFENLGALVTAAGALVVFVVAAGRALGDREGPAPPRAPAVAARSRLPVLLTGRHQRRFQRPVLLVNPGSGRGGQPKRVRLSGLTAAARRHGVEVRYLAAGEDLGTLAQRAVADGADVLGIAGGDGSVSRVASIAIGYGVPLVCVPAGTRNHFARDLGLDRGTPASALEAFATGEERRVDVGAVGDLLFLNNVSIGVYATLVHSPTYRSDRIGAINNLLPGVLRGDHPPVKLSFTGPDGRTWDQALVLLVSNNAYPIAGFGSRPRLDAGQLQVSVLQPADGAGYARALGLAASQDTAFGEHWARWGATSFRLDSPEGRLALGIDGEPVELATPLEFQVVPQALRVLVPPRPPDTVSRMDRMNRLLNVDTVRQLLDTAGLRLDGGPRRDRPAPRLPHVPPHGHPGAPGHPGPHGQPGEMPGPVPPPRP